MARAIPVCAIMASRLACALVRIASVATTAMVVFSTGVAAAPPFSRMASMSGVNEAGRPRPPYSPPTSNGAAQNHGPSPTVTLPTAFTATMAPTVAPKEVFAEAEPALEVRCGGAHARADAAERECIAGRGRGGIGEIAIGWKAPPTLVAAVEEIETDRAGHDRDHGVADPEAAA